MQALKTSLSKKGFDIQVWFSSSVYNDYLSAKGLSDYHLPVHESKCMLVGNTKNLWPCFIEKANGQTLDSYTLSQIYSVTKEYVNKFSVYFVFDDYIIHKDQITKGKKRIAFQTLGQSIGFSSTIPGTGLAVTREHGPWFAFRAVIVFHDQISDDDSKYSKQNIQVLEKWINEPITADQLKSFEKMTQDALSFTDSYKKLIEIRKEIGILLHKKALEYGYNQMMYHYTKSEEFLKL